MFEFITPDWPAPPQVKAYTTTRKNGYSQPPYGSFNLATHVGDDIEAVTKNRNVLQKALAIPSKPIWLEQVHSNITTTAILSNINCKADASYTDKPEQVCVILTADCMPVLFCNKTGTKVAAIHAGWRGLANGILEEVLQYFDSDVLVWLGPAIGPQAFEVGEDVYAAFTDFLPQASKAFTLTDNNHWLADLYLLARQRLAYQGITAVFGGKFCTYSEPERFYSYRRDKATGRMASLIWLEDF
ncbi:peptidoglycan editing factor PgeF [Candidatus Halobeggiatoa sp. HSG11]|nr:peptidoglycan editing factor PgeF [Candidatus Halobeggiatoa sp. HSG11]